jgi:hypothetical protein
MYGSDTGFLQFNLYPPDGLFLKMSHPLIGYMEFFQQFGECIISPIHGAGSAIDNTLLLVG